MKLRELLVQWYSHRRDRTPATDAAHTDWPTCIAIAMLSVVGLVFGHQLHACDSIWMAMLWTVMLLGFFMLLVPQYVGSVLLLAATIALTLRAMSATAKGRDIVALLAFALPTVCIVIGLALASLLQSTLTCSWGFWR